MKSRVIINIDWLSLYIKLSKPFEEFSSVLTNYYSLESEKYGTRFYKSVVECKKDNQPFATICHTPHSPILEPLGINVKFDNRVLYTDTMWDDIDCFLQCLGQSEQSAQINRLDICADFNVFANGMLPYSVIANLAATRFRKIGKSKFAFYGVQTKTNNLYSGVRYGVHGSEMSVYLYNKSRELKEKVYKPYIVERWVEQSFDIENVWRLEISMNPKQYTFVDKLSGEQIDLNLPTLRSRLVQLYFLFAFKHFRIYDTSKQTDSNITRQRILPLLQWSNVRTGNISPLRPISCHSTYDKGVVNYLRKFVDEKLKESDTPINDYKEIMFNAACVIRRLLNIN